MLGTLLSGLGSGGARQVVQLATQHLGPGLGSGGGLAGHPAGRTSTLGTLLPGLCS